MDYNWCTLYRNFSEKLIKYKNNRRNLISKIEVVLREFEVFIEKNGNIVNDICPFSILSIFNRGNNKQRNCDLFNRLNKLLEFNLPKLNSNENIPTIANEVRYFGSSDIIGKNDIDNLWELFESALHVNDDSLNDLIDNLDIILNQAYIGKNNITIALYWVNPSFFIPLTPNITSYLNNNYDIDIPSFTAERYIYYIKHIKEKIHENDISDITSFINQICSESINTEQNTNIEESSPRKSEFRKWLSNVVNSNGTYFKRNTINQYVSHLAALSKKMYEANLIKSDIFEIDSLQELESIYEIFENSKDIKDYFNGTSYNIYTIRNGFKNYLEFFNMHILGNDDEIVLNSNKEIIEASGYKKEFRKWLSTQVNNNGTYYKKNTINQYVGHLAALSKKMIDDGFISIDIFEIDSFDELKTVYVLFDNSLDLKEYFDNSCYNYYTIGKSFRNYLNFFEREVIGNENIVEEEISVDQVDNRNNFSKWLSNQINSRGEKFSTNSINQYVTLLSTVSKKLAENGLVAKNIYDMITVKEVEDTFRLLQKSNLISTFQSNNQPVKSAFSLYIEYLDNNTYYEKPTIVEHFSQLNDDGNDIYSQNDFLREVFIDDDLYQTLKNRLEIKKNIIIQGAPGVGKSFLAKKLAYSIIGGKDKECVEMIQFHQNYSYEDFVMGYRPDGKGTFILKSGIFYNLCKKSDLNKDKKYFLIIDEINRGNLSKIFGELLFLIEADKRGFDYSIPLMYKPESRFYVPENLYIIGIMNTADRSLAFMDYALRRRFSFITIDPQFDSPKFIKYIQSCKESEYLFRIIDSIKVINNVIQNDETLGKGFKIGHSYFCNLKNASNEKIKEIIFCEVIPLLEEYWVNDEKKLKQLVNGLLEVLK